MKKKITYAEAFEKLEKIVSGLENAEIDIDELSGKIRQAKEYLEICQKKLTEAEKDVNDILSGMENE